MVNGTDPDGKRYGGTSMLSIALAPSGALEIDWDNGKQVGVGQLVGNVPAVAYSVKGRSAILIMNINRDGSLSGKWSRRTDRGYKGIPTSGERDSVLPIQTSARGYDKWPFSGGSVPSAHPCPRPGVNAKLRRQQALM
jgi:hypothetical protein